MGAILQASSIGDYGMLGLLNVISMQNPDLTTLALGTDLTTLGLHLNSSEQVCKTFENPWADGPIRPDPAFKVGCHLVLLVGALLRSIVALLLRWYTKSHIFYATRTGSQDCGSLQLSPLVGWT
jgi:hypothetical protein